MRGRLRVVSDDNVRTCTWLKSPTGIGSRVLKTTLKFPQSKSLQCLKHLKCLITGIRV
ncbi:hypothetical protein DCAR_0101838 [Daucus carota subsp. sativus]|uniref:Uncharacterized protein n=1 Tax=Daucus carota subsp. sativus TaxID=79200 RepID=A0A161YMV1_DAUCS|nr:hypothetical protein DCAR_0101838 [Daucus carota subsp. sativus]